MPLSPTQTNNRTDLPSRQHCWTIMKRHHHNPWRCTAITHKDRWWSRSTIQARLLSDHEKALSQPTEVHCYHPHRQLMELTDDGVDLSSGKTVEWSWKGIVTTHGVALQRWSDGVFFVDGVAPRQDLHRVIHGLELGLGLLQQQVWLVELDSLQKQS